MSRVELPDGTVCHCGHGPVKHPEALDGECTAAGCGCKAFRDRHEVQAQRQSASLEGIPDEPQPAAPRPVTVTPGVEPAKPSKPAPEPVAGLTLGQLMRAAQDCGQPRLIRKAQQILQAAAELQTAVKAVGEVERLERELAEARRRAGLAGRPPGRPPRLA